MPASKSDSTEQRLLQTIKSLQFIWFIGHVLTLLGSLAYFLAFLTFRFNQRAYSIAYLGALVSYSVVIFKSHGFPRIQSVKSFAKDENIQYFLIALFWYFSEPVSVTLIPYVIFSTFHAMGYIRKNIIPTFFPIENDDDNNVWQIHVQLKLKQYSDSYYGTAMRWVAQIEVIGIMGRLLLGLLGFRVMPVFVFGQFLRFRYGLSVYTRQVFHDVRVLLDRMLLPPTASESIPPIITNCYITAKDMIIRYGHPTVATTTEGARAE